MLIHGNILFIMRLKRDHQLLLIRVMNDRTHEPACDSLPLHGRPHGKVYDMQPLILVQLIRPPGIQIVPADQEVPQRLEGMILLNQKSVRPKARQKLGQIKGNRIIRLALI